MRNEGDYRAKIMKKMFDFMKTKKWLLLILAAVLVVALVVGIALAGKGEKEQNPTVGTSEATEPTGTTGGNGNEVTEPDDVTEPSKDPIYEEPEIHEPPADLDDPDLSDPTEPTTPNGEAPDVTPPPGPNDDDEPTQGNGSATPSTPVEDDEDSPVEEDPKPTQRPVDTSYDFGGVTPSNITLDIWLSWSAEKHQAFFDTYDSQYLTWDLDTRWRYNCVTSYNEPYYKDGFYCATEDGYKLLLAEWEEPCDYCGKSRCEDILFRNDNGLTQIDPRRCSEYDIHKDPMEYCQICGLKVGYEGCMMFVYDSNCRYCGEWVEAMTCHHCEEYDD